VPAAVPAPVQPDFAGAGAGPHRDRCGAGEPGERCPGTEPVDPGGLTDDHRRRQHTAAGDRQQGRRQGTHQVAQLGVQAGDLSVQLLAAVEEVTGDPGHHTRHAGQPLLELGDHGLATQPPRGDFQGRVEFVEVPTDLRRYPGPLIHQVTAVIGEQLHFPGRPVQLGARKVRIPQRRPSDRLGVDRIRLARLPRGPPRLGHQPGRHADHHMPGP